MGNSDNQLNITLVYHYQQLLIIVIKLLNSFNINHYVYYHNHQLESELNEMKVIFS